MRVDFSFEALQNELSFDSASVADSKIVGLSVVDNVTCMSDGPGGRWLRTRLYGEVFIDQ